MRPRFGRSRSLIGEIASVPQTINLRARWAIVPWRIALVAVCLALPTLGDSTSRAGQIQTWQLTGRDGFTDASLTDLVPDARGQIALDRPVQPEPIPEVAQVWDIAVGLDESRYAASGDRGQILRRVGEGLWEPWLEAESTQVLSLCLDPDGALYAGTDGSGGVILRITSGPTSNPTEVADPEADLDRPRVEIERIRPEIGYIWDVEADASGAIYAATGPRGQVWRRDPIRQIWTRVLQTDQRHVLCLALDDQGTLYAGTDGPGLIYQLRPGQPSRVLLDSPEGEVRCLTVDPEGLLYFGSAVPDPDTSNAPITDPSAFLKGLILPAGSGRDPSTPLPSLIEVPEPKPIPTRPGTAIFEPGKPGINAVYRVDDEGKVRRLLQLPGLVQSLLWDDGALIIGTGQPGHVLRLDPATGTVGSLARLDHDQVLCLTRERDGAILVGLGSSGGLARILPEFRSRGTLTSPVHDAGLISRFGALRWRGSTPEGTAIQLRARSGPTRRIDASWSDWSDWQTIASASLAEVPAARFVQIQAELSTTRTDRSPILEAITLLYQSRNLPPELSDLQVPDVASADGSEPRDQFELSWTARDPNEDDLRFQLRLRKQDWPDWVPIDQPPLAEPQYRWDTRAWPSGLYRIEVIASDRPSNPESQAQRGRLESRSFLVDHDPPTIVLVPRGSLILATLSDDWTRLTAAEYALDGGPWTPLYPIDRLFDTQEETIEIPIGQLDEGPHVLVVRAVDAAGNQGTADLVVNSR